MKNCTKLHFRYFNTVTNEFEYIEDFFLGGVIKYYDGKVHYQPKNSLLTYELVPEDYQFVDINNQTMIDGQTYVKILPIYDAKSLKQNLECRCSIIRGELDYNTRLGIPLKTQLDEKRLAIMNIINQTQGVESSEVLSMNIINKKLIMKVSIVSNFGNFVVSFS